MRTTVDLPDDVRARVQEIATRTGRSLSATVAELAMRGLARREAPLVIDIDPKSGFPVTSFGHTITDADVAESLDDE